MSRGRSLRRLWRSPYVVAAAVLLFASGLAGGGATLASFAAETQNNTSTFAGGWIGAATGPFTVTPTGYNATLGWTPATHGLDGQQLYGLDNGTSATCPASGYTSLATMASATTNGYTDSSTSLDNPRSKVNGHYVCYRMTSTRSGSSWTASASFPATILGLVPTGISYSPTGSLANGSVITITYNQNVSLSSTSLTVCVSNNSQPIVILGNGSCTPTIGSFTGGTDTSRSITCGSSTAGVVGGTSLQVTLNGCGNGRSHTGNMSGGPVTYTGVGSVVTSSVGAAVQCTTSLCTPQMTSW